MALNGKYVPELAPLLSITTAMRISLLVYKEITGELSDFISQSSHSGKVRTFSMCMTKMFRCYAWFGKWVTSHRHNFLKPCSIYTLWILQILQRLSPLCNCFLQDLHDFKKQSHTLERLHTHGRHSRCQIRCSIPCILWYAKTRIMVRWRTKGFSFSAISISFLVTARNT